VPAPLAALLRALLVWLLIMLGESLHGALRRLLFSPDVIFALRQASVVVGVLIVFAVTWVCLPWLRLRSPRAALAIGAFWVGLTLAFEAALGRLMGLGWDRIFAEYDLGRGALMPLGLLAMALTPWLVLRLQTAPRNLRKRPEDA
jgi:hypothetical protein